MGDEFGIGDVGVVILRGHLDHTASRPLEGGEEAVGPTGVAHPDFLVHERDVVQGQTRSEHGIGAQYVRIGGEHPGEDRSGVYAERAYLHDQFVTKLLERQGFHRFLQLYHRYGDDDHVESMKEIGRIESREVFNIVLFRLFRLYSFSTENRGFRTFRVWFGNLRTLKHANTQNSRGAD